MTDSQQNNRNKRPGLKQAAALKYDPQDNNAPVLVSAGQGFVAEKIIETARANEVQVVEDASLAQLLTKLSVGDEIPSELYEIVAQILIFVSGMDREYGERMSHLG